MNLFMSLYVNQLQLGTLKMPMSQKVDDMSEDISVISERCVVRAHDAKISHPLYSRGLKRYQSIMSAREDRASDK